MFNAIVGTVERAGSPLSDTLKWPSRCGVWTLKRKAQIGVQCNDWYGREGRISTVGHVEMVVEKCLWTLKRKEQIGVQSLVR